MGKRIISQRRGRGTTTYRSPSHRYVAKVFSPQSEKPFKAIVQDIIKDPARTAPLIVLNYEKGSFCLPAPTMLKVGDEITVGDNASPKTGDVSYLRDIPVGESVSN